MARATAKPKYTLEIEAAANGRIRQAHVLVLADGRIVASDKADLNVEAKRRSVGKSLARQLGEEGESEKWTKLVEDVWREKLEDHRRLLALAASGSPEAAAVETIAVLDVEERAIRRPLALIDGTAYASSWLTVKREKQGESPVMEHHLFVVRNDGMLFADVAANDAHPLRDLGVGVRLPAPPPPGLAWSGGGVKRYAAGERPDPTEVFRRVVAAVDAFVDFSRSLAPQETMCEMAACYILGTWFLDAFNVVGYLWPNGERGTGKTQFLQTVSEMAYLGQVILAGSSYPCLRDLADYGATLAFDDAEAVMDARRTDPDKRTLLLAGNRRGAAIAVKELVGERWETRHVHTFCPRLFSAIRLPDEILGSRSIVVPLVRSGDPRRSKRNPCDADDWPTDRRQLRDDLWALGVSYVAEMRKWDKLAAEMSDLTGRNLDPWRTILAVAGWLEERGVVDLFARMDRLSTAYQVERGEMEEADRTRMLLRALLDLSASWKGDEIGILSPATIAERMCQIAAADNLSDADDRAFTSAKRVGWLLKRQRFHKSNVRNNRAKVWEFVRGEIVAAAAAYGVVPTEETSV